MLLHVLSALVPILLQLPADTAVQHVAQSRKLGAAAAQLAARGQLDSAYVMMDAARSLRPMHPGLLRETARLAARAGRSGPAIDALTRLADWGLVFPLDADSALAPLKTDARFTALQSKVQRNRARIGASVPVVQLDDSVDIAEGLAWDAATGSFMVGSVRNQSVTRYAKGKPSAAFIVRGNVFSTLGIDTHAASHSLWLSSTALGEGALTAADAVGRATLRQYDLRSGALVREYVTPAGRARNTLGDVLVTRSGDVFVGDSRSGAVYRVKSGNDTLVTIVEPGMLLSAQGMVESVAGKLVISDYAIGLVRVDVASGDTRVLGFSAATTTLLGIDGLYRYGKDIIAVQNGVQPARVLRITLDAGENNVAAVEVLEQNHPNHNEPSSGVIVDGHFYYIGNSQWGEFDGTQRTATARLTRPVILDLTLPAKR